MEAIERLVAIVERRDGGVHEHASDAQARL